MLAKHYFRQATPAGWIPQPVRLEVIYRCPFGSRGYCPRDAQNAIGALKASVDGMVDAGVVPDDSAKWVSWGEFQLTREGPAGVYVTVVVQAAAVAIDQGADAGAGEGDRHGRLETLGEGLAAHVAGAQG